MIVKIVISWLYEVYRNISAADTNSSEAETIDLVALREQSGPAYSASYYAE